jgi:hypothetical protein
MSCFPYLVHTDVSQKTDIFIPVFVIYGTLLCLSVTCSSLMLYTSYLLWNDPHPERQFDMLFPEEQLEMVFPEEEVPRVLNEVDSMTVIDHVSANGLSIPSA